MLQTAQRKQRLQRQQKNKARGVFARLFVSVALSGWKAWRHGQTAPGHAFGSADSNLLDFRANAMSGALPFMRLGVLQSFIFA
jgi:hypothetical protein